MDISETIAPNSAQVNAEDLLGGPQTVTVTSVEKGNSEQPVFIHLAEFPGRTFRPAKTVRRIIIAAWGAEASAYAGRRMTIYTDPDVKFGGQAVGGIRISHMSHIDGPLSINLTVTRGKRAPFKVQPLTTDPMQVEKAVAAIRNAATIPELDKIGAHADKVGISGEVRDAIDTRRAELEAQDQSDGSDE